MEVQVLSRAPDIFMSLSLPENWGDFFIYANKLEIILWGVFDLSELDGPGRDIGKPRCRIDHLEIVIDRTRIGSF